MRFFANTKLSGVLLLAVLVLAGCTSAPKEAVQDTNTPKVEKPPLVVPKTFESEAAKVQFAARAVVDGYYAEAKPLLEEALPTAASADGFKLLGTARYNLGDYTGAIEAWNNAADLNSALKGEMLNNIGNALRDSHKPEEAEKAWRDALRIEPTRWTAAVNLAAELKLKGKVKEAVAVLEGAVPANRNIEVLKSLLASYKQEM